MSNHKTLPPTPIKGETAEEYEARWTKNDNSEKCDCDEEDPCSYCRLKARNERDLKRKEMGLDDIQVGNKKKLTAFKRDLKKMLYKGRLSRQFNPDMCHTGFSPQFLDNLKKQLMNGIDLVEKISKQEEPEFFKKFYE